MKTITFFLCICIFICACHKVNFHKIKTPKDYTIDIDGNGEDDFGINYKQVETLDLPPSGAAIHGEIRFLHQGAFFCNIMGAYSECLFLQGGDTIKTDLAINQWNYYPVNVISIGWQKGKWDKNWYINGSNSSPYFLGFQMQDKLGYLTLDLNTETGEITVLDSKLTNEDFLIINP